MTYANVRQKRGLSVFDEDDSNMLTASACSLAA
jgi:hypothetical protein